MKRLASDLYFENKEGFSAKKKLAVSIAVLAIIAIVYLAANTLPWDAPSEEGGLQAAEVIGTGLLEAKRETYGISLGVFEDLPEPPNDFDRMVSAMHSSQFRNYAFFSEDYFLQPEFFPSFPLHALSYWKEPNPDYYAAMGFGFFPSEQKIRVGIGETVTARFFVHTAFGVQSFQGTKLSSPESIQGIELVVSVQEFLLGPAFPKFDKNWVQAVDVVIHAGEEATAGSYRFEFALERPSSEKSSEWEEQYKGRYFNASTAGANIYHALNVQIE